ncbi:hypothetical protein BBIA_2137 [Bifidobacterium biavatii DSM 23969]|uniref:Uncharacterized protein n=1 Tax=Bifidobacterium biavatii DSM 23969 TaxID=1437608 RepID=A0A086ZU04_9BIFI|nr:hypothetical protein BBIA_2137 [Bifidobacterium biavatii DSM 23969]
MDEPDPYYDAPTDHIHPIATGWEGEPNNSRSFMLYYED